MIIDTNIIPEGHSVARQSCELDAVKESLPPFSGAVAEVTFDRSRSFIYCSVHFSGSFDQHCSRCLDVYPFPVSGEFRVILEERDGTGGRAPEEATADYYFSVGDPLVDISDVVYEEIMIALPIKPLCNEACTGISYIETNGADASTEPDPRWAALKKLQERDGK